MRFLENERSAYWQPGKTSVASVKWSSALRGFQLAVAMVAMGTSSSLFAQGSSSTGIGWCSACGTDVILVNGKCPIHGASGSTSPGGGGGGSYRGGGGPGFFEQLNEAVAKGYRGRPAPGRTLPAEPDYEFQRASEQFASQARSIPRGSSGARQSFFGLGGAPLVEKPAERRRLNGTTANVFEQANAAQAAASQNRGGSGAVFDTAGEKRGGLERSAFGRLGKPISKPRKGGELVMYQKKLPRGVSLPPETEKRRAALVQAREAKLKEFHSAERQRAILDAKRSNSAEDKREAQRLERQSAAAQEKVKQAEQEIQKVVKPHVKDNPELTTVVGQIQYE